MLTLILFLKSEVYFEIKQYVLKYVARLLQCLRKKGYSLRKDTAEVITMVAIKAKVSKLSSCDIEANKVKDEVKNVNSTPCE